MKGTHVRKYHFVLAQAMDVEARRREAVAGDAPRHFFLALAERMGAAIHAPEKLLSEPVKRNLVHKILNTSDPFIALAEQVAAACGEEDVIFCLGEAVALPIAYALRRRGKKTRLASFGHNLQRPRVRAAALLAGVVDRVDLFFVFTQEAVQNPQKFRLYTEQTDDAFFCAKAGPLTAARKDASRPLLVSVGLEMRDNFTLAEATRDLAVDVSITAFSKDAAPTGRAVPDPLPNNMTSRFYAWRELVDLYTAADIVVVPLCPTTYAAGITSILEAAATGKPIIATRTQALRDAFAAPDSVCWVPPEDPKALRQAVLALMAEPERRADMAARAARAQKAHHSFQPALEEMMVQLEAL